MITLLRGNSYSQIKGLTADQFQKLRKELSYLPSPKAAYYTGGYAHRRYLLSAKGSFPSGLCKRVLAFMRREGLRVVVEDRRTIPTPQKLFKLQLGPITPRYRQAEAAVVAAERGQGVVQAVTAYGKSLIIALIINELQVPTLIVVPTLGLKEEMESTLTNYFGSLKHLAVENIGSAALKRSSKVQAIIWDEIHHGAANTYHKLNKSAWEGIYYRTGLTATYFRNQDQEQLLLEALAGDVLYNISYKDALKEGAVCQVEAFYREVPKRKTDAYTWREVYDELVVNNFDLNTLVAADIISLLEVGVPTLTLVREVEHGRVLSAMTGVPFVCGEDEDSISVINDFNAGKIKSLIGTEGILGEGRDTKPAEYILLPGLGKAKSAFMQKIGRGLRKYLDKFSCKVVLYRDASHKFTLQHFRAQVKILKEEYGVETVKLED